MAERNANTSEDHRFEFRIGVNFGDVIVHDGDIYVDSVNAAARLENFAERGGAQRYSFRGEVFCMRQP